MKYVVYAILAAVMAFSTGSIAADRDQSIMLEIGWRFDNNTGAKRNAFDFGAIRYRYDDAEVHIAGWRNTEGADNVFAAGVGYVFDSEDHGESNNDDWNVTFTPGVAYTTGPAPLRLFTRTAVGYGSGDEWDVQIAHNAYMPLIEREVESDAFGTVAVVYNDRYDDSPDNAPANDRDIDPRDGGDDGDGTGDDGDGTGDDGDGTGDDGTGDDGDGNNGHGDDDGDDDSNPGNDDGDDGDGDSGGGNDGGDGDECKGGYGHGDTNHCHSGPPGQNK